jgi:mono/diheme cytochrome c family protein
VKGRRLVASLLFAAVVSATGCSRLPGKPEASEREVRPSEIRDFSALYGIHCAGCHGADGRLGAARPLDDPLYLALVDETTLERIVGRGIEGSLHPAFAQGAGGSLTDEQVRLLVEGMRERWGAPTPAGVELPRYAAGDPTTRGEDSVARGAELWSARCASCHGADGDGGPEAGSVVDPDYLALVTDQALRTAVICGRSDLGMPDWRGSGDQAPLRPEDVSDLVAWLASHRDPRGKSFGGETNE